MAGMIDRTPPPLTLPNGAPLDASAAEGTDRMAVPHVFSFASLLSGASQTYWHGRFDEAMRHARENALAMRRDAYLMSLLNERKRAVAKLPWYLEVPDPKDPVQAKTRALLTQAIRSVQGLKRIMRAHLEAIWYGRYGVQFKWRWQQIGGRKVLGVEKWAPINGDKIGYGWDDTPYVLVNGAKASQLPGAEIIRTTTSTALRLSGQWRDRFVIHKHEIDDGDYFEAESADAIHGVGVRSRIYWLDFLKRDYLDWAVTYLERVGLGTTLWKYPFGNTEAKEEAEQAARDNSRRTNITVPVFQDGRNGVIGGVEKIEAPTGSVEVLRSMQDAIDQYIERYMVGQSGSSQSQASGIGNEAASEFMSSTKDDIRDEDADNLAQTYSGDEREPGLVYLFQKYSAPETLPERGGFPVLFKFGLERSLNNQRVQTIQTVVGMGLPVRKDDVYNAAGLSRPEPQDDVLEPPQQPGMGGPGGNPLAALMGGAGGQQPQQGHPMPQEADGADGDEPASPEDIDAFLAELGIGGATDEGDDEPADPGEVDAFLGEVLGGRQYSRRGEPLTYAWTRDPSYRGKLGGKWRDSETGEVRYQPDEPGKGGGDGVRGAAVKRLAKQLRQVHKDHRAGRQTIREWYDDAMTQAERKYANDPGALGKVKRRIRQAAAEEWASHNRLAVQRQTEVRQARDEAAGRVWHEGGAASAHLDLFRASEEGAVLGDWDELWGGEPPREIADLAERLDLLAEHTNETANPEDVHADAAEVARAAAAVLEMARREGYDLTGDDDEASAEFFGGIALIASQAAVVSLAGRKLLRLKVKNAHAVRREVHGAQYGRDGGPLHYDWTDTGPADAEGRKRRWKGTPPDKGTRVQISKPGTGRGKKAEGEKPAPKKPAKPKADPEAIKAHIDRVRSGQATPEEVEGLRAALDGLTGKQLDELKRHFKVRGGGSTVANKRDALHGHASSKPKEKPEKKPAASRKPRLNTALPGPKKAVTPAASTQTTSRNPAPSEDDIFSATMHAYAELDKESSVRIPELLDEVRRAHPEVTQEQFYQLLNKWADEDRLGLQKIGEVEAEPRGGEALTRGGTKRFYVEADPVQVERGRRARPDRRVARTAGGGSGSASPQMVQQSWSAFKEVFPRLDAVSSVKIPELFDEVKKRVPGLTQQQFHKMLLQWKNEDRITLQLLGVPEAEKRRDEALQGQKGSYFYVVMN